MAIPREYQSRVKEMLREKEMTDVGVERFINNACKSDRRCDYCMGKNRDGNDMYEASNMTSKLMKFKKFYLCLKCGSARYSGESVNESFLRDF